MADDEILRRIDRHIEETAQHIAETKGYIADNKTEMRELLDGLRLDMRQREERWMCVYRETTAETQARYAEAQARYAEMSAELRDLREESQAGRRALLAMLDRLPPPNPAS
ncbi:MAG: hypothetical protein JHC84_11860 [Solirubrobacteraceae bacterium]|nr:hypothetical protein [Solirubrobacteraceae bacterium]